MTFEEWWARRLGEDTADIGPMCDAPVTKRQARIIFSAGAWTERERCAGIADAYCHCEEHYTERGLVDPTCDCHAIADDIRGCK